MLPIIKYLFYLIIASIIISVLPLSAQPLDLNTASKSDLIKRIHDLEKLVQELTAFQKKQAERIEELERARENDKKRIHQLIKELNDTKKQLADLIAKYEEMIKNMKHEKDSISKEYVEIMKKYVALVERNTILQIDYNNLDNDLKREKEANAKLKTDIEYSKYTILRLKTRHLLEPTIKFYISKVGQFKIASLQVTMPAIDEEFAKELNDSNITDITVSLEPTNLTGTLLMCQMQTCTNGIQTNFEVGVSDPRLLTLEFNFDKFSEKRARELIYFVKISFLPNDGGKAIITRQYEVNIPQQGDNCITKNIGAK